MYTITQNSIAEFWQDIWDKENENWQDNAWHAFFYAIEELAEQEEHLL
ncbi:hypothetical protein H6790_00795 [Candidatus Nomurabacteria bacterium]|nr:hypothetical protein [Candidatus Nomurabacteria bacterium]MCB9820471.1 hypothetical protein [Candidatus Nomurabacteria bacterium]